MRIQHNITAMNSYRNYNTNDSKLASNLEKLSSGFKINRAGDDAAGLAISEKMRAQITGLNVAQKNAKDGISVVQAGEGALTEVHDMLNRMYELAEESCNGTYGETERQKLQSEVKQLQSEITRISNATNFNGMNLLDGSMSGTSTVSANFSALLTTNGTVPATSQLVAAINLNNSGITDDADINANKVTTLGNDVSGVNVKMTVTVATATSSRKIEVKAANMTYSASSLSAELLSGSTVTLYTSTNGKSITITLNKDLDMAKGTGYPSNADIGMLYGAKALGHQDLILQIGDTAASYNQMTVSVEAMSAEALGVGGLDISTYEGSVVAMNAVLTAIDIVSTQRSELGATQNRLDHTINNLSTMEENIQDAESTIRDTDVAEEMMAYTKNNILLQSAQSMLAQANQLPQSVLQLLQG